MGKTIDKEKLYNNLEKCYCELAYMDLALVYYSFCEKDETPEDFGRDKAEMSTDFRKRLEKLIPECFKDVAALRTIRADAFSLRNDIKELVNRLVDKRERIALDEYVEERKGAADEPFNFTDDDDAARKILQAIFAYDDNPTINENIKTTVYELPVRMTKGRFFDILEDGLKKYIGGPYDALQRAVYMIESAAGLRGEKVTDILIDDASILDAETEYLNDIAELANFICVLTECSDDILAEMEEKKEKLLQIVKAISDSNTEAADTLLTHFEGDLERLSEDQVVFEGRFDSLLEQNFGQTDERGKKLDMMKRLMSVSVYADLFENDETENTAEVVNKAFTELKEKLENSFAAGERALNRARMAAVLSSLPVFFNSRTDCMNYVRDALSACRDNHEKNVAVGNVLKSISLL